MMQTVLPVFELHLRQLQIQHRQVEEVRALGYGVNVWTVNSPSRAAELFSWGVTGVFTDRVHALAPLVA